MFLIHTGSLSLSNLKESYLRTHLNTHLKHHFCPQENGQILWGLKHDLYGELRTSCGSSSGFRGDDRGSMTLEFLLILPVVLTFLVCMILPLKAYRDGMLSITEAYSEGVRTGAACTGGEQFAVIGFDVSGGGVVYVTGDEEVYHTDRCCTSLVRRICVGVCPQYAGGLFRDGSRDACFFCGSEGGSLPLVYYTKKGEAYHTSRACPALKRLVMALPAEEALNDGLRPCEICAGGGYE